MRSKNKWEDISKIVYKETGCMWTEVIWLRIGFGVKTLGNTVINIHLS